METNKRTLEVLKKQYGENKIMSNKQIKKMLTLHSIDFFEENNKIYAIELYTTRNGRRCEETKDLTGISRLNLLAWLGY